MLDALFDETVEERLTDILVRIGAAAGAEEVSEAGLMMALRNLKLEAHFLIALADLSGEADTAATVERLSELAGAFVRAAAGFLLRDADRQGKLNAALSGAELDQYCVMQADAQALLFQAMRRLSGSGRALHRALRVARTVADLEGADVLGASHVAQAVQYRRPGL